MSVNISNNLEMKVKSDADSTGVKKISLIENLSLSQSYNFAADSLRLSNLNVNVLLRLAKNFNLNLNTTWDPYVYKLNASGSPVRVNRYRWQEKGKGLLKLSSTPLSPIPSTTILSAARRRRIRRPRATRIPMRIRRRTASPGARRRGETRTSSPAMKIRRMRTAMQNGAVRGVSRSTIR